MNKPLGKNIGNSLAVRETINILRDGSEGPLKEVSTRLTAELMVQSEEYKSVSSAEEKLDRVIESGEALLKFKEMIENQGGNTKIIKNLDLLPSSDKRTSLKTDEGGVLTEIDPLKIAQALNSIKDNKGIKPDYSSGIEIKAEIGDKVEKSDTLAILHYNREEGLKESLDLLEDSFQINSDYQKKSEREKLIKSIMRGPRTMS